jgi:diamine N-acetyltransferase
VPELEAPGSRFFVARVGNAAAGYLKLNTGDAQGERLEGVGLEIEAIYVRTGCQSMGIGSLMLAHARRGGGDRRGLRWRSCSNDRASRR